MYFLYGYGNAFFLAYRVETLSYIDFRSTDIARHAGKLDQRVEVRSDEAL